MVIAAVALLAAIWSLFAQEESVTAEMAADVTTTLTSSAKSVMTVGTDDATTAIPARETTMVAVDTTTHANSVGTRFGKRHA